MYFHPFGPVKVIVGILGSMAVIVAVTVRCVARVPPGRVCPAPVVPPLLVSTSGSPGFFTRTMTFS